MDVEIVHTGGRYGELVAENLRRRCPDNRVGSLCVSDALPLIVDDPQECLPPQMGQAEVVIALHIHPDLLYEIPHAAAHGRTRALIAPIEDPGWMQQGLINQVSRACARFEIESAFPRPFCALEAASPVIAEFCQTFGVGRPDFDIIIENGTVTDVVFRRGSPCGSTEWALRHLVGRPSNADLVHAVSEGLHTYPCLASMALDPSLGDTIMHEAIRLIESAARRAAEARGGGGRA